MGASSPVRRPASPWSGRRAPGFTLIELLVVIAIIAVLLAILLPSLTKAREQGKATLCRANLKDIGVSTTMYLQDSDDNVIRWYTTPFYNQWGAPGGYTPYVFGGCKAPDQVPGPGGVIRDAQRYPVNTFNGAPDPTVPGRTIDVRPLNKLAAPDARDDDLVFLYRCPSDRTREIKFLGQGPGTRLDDEEAKNAFESFGSSYSLNARFMQGYDPAGPAIQGRHDEFAKRVSRIFQGGHAARFIVWVEHGMYASTHSARPTLAESLAVPQRNGWHREFSKWSMGFADGHAEYRYINTRLCWQADWSIWDPTTPWP